MRFALTLFIVLLILISAIALVSSARGCDGCTMFPHEKELYTEDPDWYLKAIHVYVPEEYFNKFYEDYIVNHSRYSISQLYYWWLQLLCKEDILVSDIRISTKGTGDLNIPIEAVSILPIFRVPEFRDETITIASQVFLGCIPANYYRAYIDGQLLKLKKIGNMCIKFNTKSKRGIHIQIQRRL